MEGREGREGFGASTGRKKQKMGGTSNKEKSKRKNLPIAARLQAVRPALPRFEAPYELSICCASLTSGPRRPLFLQIQRRSRMNKLKSNKSFRGKKAYHTG